MKQEIRTANNKTTSFPYSQAIKTSGELIFVSGQLPINPIDGKVVEGIEAQTMQSITNIKEILAVEGCTLDNVVKSTVFLADISLFAEMNKVYAAQFKAPHPARSAFAVRDLPMNVLVEIEVIASK